MSLKEDNLVALVQVLEEDERLRSWFLSLSKLPLKNRLWALQSMLQQMRSDNEPEDLINLIRGLSSDQTYQAILKVIEV